MRPNVGDNDVPAEMSQLDAKDSPVFRLYVAGSAPNSALALENFKAIAHDCLTDYELEVIDIQEEPLRALQEGVLITPTLVRISPPVLRIIGNLSETTTVLVALGLTRRSAT